MSLPCISHTEALPSLNEGSGVGHPPLITRFFKSLETLVYIEKYFIGIIMMPIE